MLKMLKLSENEIQKCVFKHLRQRSAPGVFAFHPKNGGVHQRGRHRGINAGLGVVSGVPDVIVIKPRVGADAMLASEVYALELKAEGGKLAPVQGETMERMAQAGAVVGVAVGLDAALRWLEEYGILQGRAA